jgi:ubiquinone/menaquinone biosynthesis C-methylase UbiE
MKKSDSQENYWNSVAFQKEFTTPLNNNLINRYFKETSVILDVGCGYGRTLAELQSLGFQNLYGIDFSEKMIERGKRLYPSVQLQVNSGSEIPFPNESFDAVLMFAVLTCIYNNNDQVDLIKNVMRVLKPNGILYVNDFLINEDERNVKRYQDSFAEFNNYGVFRLPEGVVLRHHLPDWLDILFSDFRREESETQIFKTMNGNTSNGFCGIFRKIN